MSYNPTYKSINKTTFACCYIHNAVQLLLGLLVLMLGIAAAEAGEEITFRDSFAGNISYELAGNSLRSSSNECARITSSADTVSIPSGSTVIAAYLYWAASGSTTDNQVTLNGTTVTANNLYTETFTYNNVTHNFFGAKADVTALVSGSGSYTVSDLSNQLTQNDCNVAVIFAGWALAVVYSNPSEAQRVINVYDGFKAFQSSSITITPSNFIVDTDPATKGGKHSHITWEGDAGNSQSVNGYSESLSFNGTTLTDSGNPNGNQFNSYSNVNGNTSGVDIDDYDISSLLTAGANSVSTVYSSGQDLVLLSAELISIPNVDTADLQITTSAAQALTRGSNASYTLTVTNNGPKTATGGTSVTIPLADNLTLASYTGTGWSCAVSGTTLTCTYNPPIAVNAAANALVINFGTTSTTQNSIDLTATVAGNLFDNRSSNNTTTLAMTLGSPDLDTSTKTVEDLNGGMVMAGDTLRYTITLTNTGAIPATAASVTDNLPANIGSFSVYSTPAGAVTTITPAPGGSNNTGQVVVSNIAVPTSSSVTVVIDAVIADGTADGTSITNTATVNNGIGTLTDLTSPPVTLNQAYAISSGNKPLYLQTNNTMTRVAAASSTSYTQVVHNNSQTWTLTPALAKALQLNYSGGIPLQLVASNGNTSTTSFSATHNITVAFSAAGTEIARGTISSSLNNLTRSVITVNLSVSNGITIPAGSAVTLNIYQSCTSNCGSSNSNSRRNIRIYPTNSGSSSQLNLTSYSVINVDSVLPYSAAYAGGTVLPFVMENSTAYLRAVVSDPFGYADITSTTMTIIDPNGNTVLNNQSLSPVASSGATSIYEYASAIPTGITKGNWKVIVNTKEGYENTVSASYTRTIKVTGRPIMTVAKSNVAIRDPINGTNNPKAIPGADVLYTLNVRNTGEGTIDADTMVVSDVIPLLTPLYVGDLVNGSPIEFVEGANPSLLTLTFSGLASTTDDVEFSNDNGNSFGYVPVPNGEGFDYAVTHFRVSPKGTMPEAGNGVTPGFLLRYKVRVP